MPRMRLFDRELSAPKRYFQGTHRVCSPQETLASCTRFMAELGITRLANVTGLDSIGIPVWCAVRPNSRSVSVSQGKGLDSAAAKASALLESIEGWHGENVDRPLRLERWSSLVARAAAVDLELVRLPRTTPDPDLARPVLWIEGWDLVADEPCWVPYESVSTSFVLPNGSSAPTFLVTTNGLASGNHLLEATAHALCEVIERDALAGWHELPSAAQEPHRLDLATVADAPCRELLRRFAAADVRVAAWRLPTPFGVPVMQCTIEDDRPQWRPVGALAGSGCHLDPAIALGRALTEAAQARLTLIAGSRDDVTPAAALALRTSATSQPDDPRRPPGPLAFSGVSMSAGSFEEDVAILVDALRRHGVVRAVVVDLTRESIGVPVVKVVVPGLRDERGRSLRELRRPGSPS